MTAPSFMDLALEAAETAGKAGEVPVGCVIVRENDVIASAGNRTLTDIVALVRYTLHQDDQLVPFRDQVEERFAAWLAAQQQRGVTFSVEQLQWLTWMKDNVIGELAITTDSFEFTPFAEHGGIGKAVQVFGDGLAPLMEELTEVLAAGTICQKGGRGRHSATSPKSLAE